MADKKQYVKGQGLEGTVPDLSTFKTKDVMKWTKVKKGNSSRVTPLGGLKTLANSMKLKRRK
tara:strand:- start:34 stop:219 length:186 start_codon:yes stop_codon:yes gene_type:complete